MKHAKKSMILRKEIFIKDFKVTNKTSPTIWRLTFIIYLRPEGFGA